MKKKEAGGEDCKEQLESRNMVVKTARYLTRVSVAMEEHA